MELVTQAGQNLVFYRSNVRFYIIHLYLKPLMKLRCALLWTRLRLRQIPLIVSKMFPKLLALIIFRFHCMPHRKLKINPLVPMEIRKWKRFRLAFYGRCSLLNLNQEECNSQQAHETLIFAKIQTALKTT